MLECLRSIKKVIKETEQNIEKVENNSQGKMIDNDVIISFKAGAYEKIVTEMKRFARRKKNSSSNEE